MKVAILAGGLGTRLAEETGVKPKPMVKIAGKPILWHIMMHYSYYGFRNFAIALGYKGEVIKKYMVDYCSLNSTLTVDFPTGEVTMKGGRIPPWKVDLVDTEVHTQTGGRLKRLTPYLDNETFMLTYGDGVSDINLSELLAFHRSHGKLATLTVVHPPARFGYLELDGEYVKEFSEKPQTREGWINGGFFVLEPAVLDYIDGDDTQWEKEPLERLAKDGQLMAYQHTSFWQCMDTLRDKRFLEALWQSGDIPWKVWEEQNAFITDRSQGLHWDNSDPYAVGRGA
ncbi:MULTISPECIES: glucose-1-phosphate cytidylyltransferase [unclassified Coleofasciculus]|uniref:glucose-1-phosphate cytidylyltransferase n=1 Tax=unclassified Coleofasciculus TaxID=2692782 RepID=UPI0018812E63|nr:MULTISPECIES: glucose-1-phosphate cytidylyltransferase [unclassified Coleofasciculus]MBE9125733.1 glucose-1-phosphate cytidylyltransferase [Coleofasciculus sp. LEGE 07081]MBE9147221.1 glucose-1-phosphate cytidylyltransferase [Coleofasciculus sp. LEGE 07092]